MKLSQFRFKLPENLIAQYPEPCRDEARLMVVHRKTGEIEHRVFKDIIEYFNDGDVMVFNDSKVFPPQDCTATKRRPEPALKYSC